MGDVFNILLLQNTLRTATPVVLAALGCLMTQHVNITNIGIEGMMLIGAFFAVLGSYFAGSWAAGLAWAFLLCVCYQVWQRRVHHRRGAQHLRGRAYGVPPAHNL